VTERRPRLLILVTLAEAGGAQTFAAALAEGLKDRYRIEVAAHGPEGALVDACTRLSLPFHHIPSLRRAPHPWRDIRAGIEIKKLVERVRPDIVQVNSSKAGFVARIALRGLGVPIVYVVHGWAFRRGGLGSFLYAQAERATAPLADAIICVSERDRDAAEARGIASTDQLHVVQNGIAVPERPLLRGRWPDRPVLVCVARLAPPKNLRPLLTALAEPELEPWRLRIVGDGPDRSRLEAQRDALGLGERVEMLGERRDVGAQLIAADAFVLPSDSEGLPYSILEAMAMGLPVVASDVGGIPEEVVDGTTGILVPKGDHHALARALRQLHTHGDEARRMGIAGHARARERFSRQMMVERYDAILRGVLKKAPSGETRPELARVDHVPAGVEAD
jgi:glycosyltransferase involved in cell wall biosynthesis